MEEWTGLKTHPGWDDAFAERDTYVETNEFSHNRDGNILYRHTEGCWAFAHLEVCRLKNCQCGIKQRLRNDCREKKSLLHGGLNNKSAPYSTPSFKYVCVNNMYNNKTSPGSSSEVYSINNDCDIRLLTSGFWQHSLLSFRWFGVSQTSKLLVKIMMIIEKIN